MRVLLSGYNGTMGQVLKNYINTLLYYKNTRCRNVSSILLNFIKQWINFIDKILKYGL